MDKRGVTRPGTDKESSQHQKQMHHSGGGMSKDDRRDMLHMHYKQTLWVYWTLILLGAWVIMSPLTFSYAKDIVEPSGGRSIWLSDSARVLLLKWSDIISGTLLIIFGWRSLMPNRPVSRWVTCFIGIWISTAPLVFWAPNAAAYMNGTVIGALVVALSILIPGMPNMIMYMKMGGNLPRGWSYNPSSWPQRWIMIVLAFFGWMVSRYLGAFQMGYIDTMWDPFFGAASEKVLNSDMSHSLPISDGAMGAYAYTFEFLMGWMGAPTRWRTMPWMVTFFGILVIPLGLVHIFLVISQPVIVGHWCTMCLLAAAIMLPMIPLEFDEVIAMIQHMKNARKKGGKFWTIFWKGGHEEGLENDERSAELMDLPRHPRKVAKASVFGMSIPWTLLVATMVGIIVMFVPGIFNVSIEKGIADLNHLAGALIIVVSVMAMGEVIRTLRYVNVLLGLALVITPWFLPEVSTGMIVANTILGVAIIPLSIPKGKITEQYGFWNSYIH